MLFQQWPRRSAVAGVRNTTRSSSPFASAKGKTHMLRWRCTCLAARSRASLGRQPVLHRKSSRSAKPSNTCDRIAFHCSEVYPGLIVYPFCHAMVLAGTLGAMFVAPIRVNLGQSVGGVNLRSKVLAIQHRFMEFTKCRFAIFSKIDALSVD